MAYGFEVYGASGVKKLGGNNRISRLHGTYSVSIGTNTTKYINIAGMTTDGTWLAFDETSKTYVHIESGRVRLFNQFYSTFTATIQVFRY